MHQTKTKMYSPERGHYESITRKLDQYTAENSLSHGQERSLARKILSQESLPELFYHSNNVKFCFDMDDLNNDDYRGDECLSKEERLFPGGPLIQKELMIGGEPEDVYFNGIHSITRHSATRPTEGYDKDSGIIGQRVGEDMFENPIFLKLYLRQNRVVIDSDLDRNN